MNKILVKFDGEIEEGIIVDKVMNYSDYIGNNQIQMSDNDYYNMLFWWKIYYLGLLYFSKIFNKVYNPDKWVLTSSGAIFCQICNFIEFPNDFNFTVYEGSLNDLMNELKNAKNIIIKDSGVSYQLCESNYISGVYRYDENVEIEFNIFEENENTGFHIFNMNNMIDNFNIEIEEGSGTVNILSHNGLLNEYSLLFVMEFEFYAEPLETLRKVSNLIKSNIPTIYGKMFLGGKAPYRLNKLRFLGAKCYDDVVEIISSAVDFYEDSFEQKDNELPDELENKFTWFPDIDIRFIDMQKSLEKYCTAKSFNEFVDYQDYIWNLENRIKKDPNCITKEYNKLTSKDFDIHFYIYYNYEYRKKTK
jgi:hypothetical protein